ncbi:MULTISPECIES: hypothetical protein [unclassified Pseudomonas]|uniref:hypothetical protein n=1 Tax=Pseudomonas imrae TaxID=2992837 RepID=UPI003965B65C
MITIRKASLDDLRALHDIGIKTYSEHFATIWSPLGMQAFLDKDFGIHPLQKTLELPEQHCWLLAHDEDARPVGFAKVNWAKPLPGSKKVGAELQKIYFLKSQRAKAMGSNF